MALLVNVAVPTPFLTTLRPDGVVDGIVVLPKTTLKLIEFDFEGDTVLGPPGTGGLATLVDRKSRYTIVVKIQSKDADHVHFVCRPASG